MFEFKTFAFTLHLTVHTFSYTVVNGFESNFFLV